jgi:predicted nucleotidyltransferase
MDKKTVAFENEILRGLVGSTVHGTAIDGQDDRDEMGVFVEPPEYVCGLRLLDHYIHGTQPEGVRSGHGDLDLTLYSLRKFARLAVQGNPSVLVLFWLPEYITASTTGEQLVSLRDAFVSRDAGWRFLGYLRSQRMALTGEKCKKVNRPELVEKYGYDTKYAMHAMRLGLQGIEYLTDRCISLPIREPDLSLCRAVRQGGMPLVDVVDKIMSVERELESLCERSTLHADFERINAFLVEAHQAHWAAAPPRQEE